MIASTFPIYADFDFFSLPDRSSLAKKFGIDANDGSFLKYPKGEISFVEKCVSERTLRLILIKDRENAIRFLPLSIYYNTGLCVAFKPSFSFDAASFSALGDLKAEMCMSLGALRLI